MHCYNLALSCEYVGHWYFLSIAISIILSAKLYVLIHHIHENTDAQGGSARGKYMLS